MYQLGFAVYIALGFSCSNHQDYADEVGFAKSAFYLAINGMQGQNGLFKNMVDSTHRVYGLGVLALLSRLLPYARGQL